MRTIAVFSLPFRGQDEFLPLAGDPGIDLHWVRPWEFKERFPRGADVIILPGSAATVADLDYLRDSGGAQLVRSHLSRGGRVVGICGGLQCLGRKLYDPYRRQGEKEETDGLGYLPLSTTFGSSMLKSQTRARCLATKLQVSGYEHRSGYSWPVDGRAERLFEIEERKLLKKRPLQSQLPPGVDWSPGSETLDGFVTSDRRVWGTYLHHIFDNESFNRMFFSTMA